MIHSNNKNLQPSAGYLKTINFFTKMPVFITFLLNGSILGLRSSENTYSNLLCPHTLSAYLVEELD